MDWDLKPVIGLPPTTTGLVLLPENKPEHSYAAVSRSGVVNMHLSEEQRKRIEEHNQSVAEFERTWYRDLDRIVKSTVPSELGAYNIGDRSITCLPAGGRRLGSGYGFWLWFVSACVLYDPPETALLPFAECATPKPYRVSFGSLYRSQDDDKSVSMLAPPIKVQADSGELRDMIMAQVHLILDEINRHHLQALGLDVHAMWHDVVRKSDVVIEIYRQEELLKQRQYIEVHEHTTDEDVRAARRVIRAIQDRDRFRVLQAADPATRLKMLQEKQNSPQPRGKSVRDPLVAIQCAILYDRHNEKDPADGRRRTWTYERLAEEFGLKSARAATEYVIAGREILRKNKDTESPAHHFVSFLLQSNLLASMKTGPHTKGGYMETKTPSVDQKSWLTVPEAAEELRIPRTRCYELIQRGELPAVRIGERSIRVNRRELEKFLLESRRVVAH